MMLKTVQVYNKLRENSIRPLTKKHDYMKRACLYQTSKWMII